MRLKLRNIPLGPPRRRESAASPWTDYLEVAVVIGGVTFAGWFVPVSYHVFGHVYLLLVIALSLRVGRWPVLAAALLSALAWNYVFIPPQMSFSVIDVDDSMVLGTYLAVALIGGQLTARIRAQERHERLNKQRATALFHLTRALAGARRLDDALSAAIAQADLLFGAQSTVLLPNDHGSLEAHAAGTFVLSGHERAIAEWPWAHASEAGRFTQTLPSAEGLHLPLLRADAVLGVFSLRLPPGVTTITEEQRELMETFAAQIALQVEREQLRLASEREKLLAESDRLHRTLLDCVSHELKTPLAVLRSAADHLRTLTSGRAATFTAEIGTATRRLEHLVANLLNQTRLEAGAIKPHLDWCDARDLIAGARRIAGDALAGRECRIEIPADLPLFKADAVLAEQALANLLLNVALHTPAGTPVLIGADTTHAGDSGFIAIADRGPGVPPEILQGGFQKFRRGKDARAGGLGLGLSIVHGVMLAQGGDVVVENNPGGGARFVLLLPLSAHESVPME